MSFEPLGAGVFSAAIVGSDSRADPELGEVSIGPADAPPGERAVARLRLQGAGTTAAEGLDLEAADGNWHLLFKENTKGSDDADRWSIADSTGTEVAQTDHGGTRKGIELRVPGEAVHWRKAKFWQPAYADSSDSGSSDSGGGDSGGSFD